jgi:quercetin dioxygenase-like cupin family protein
MIRGGRVSTRAILVVGTALLIATAAVGAIVTAGALATTPSGVTAETFRGALLEPLHVNTKLANDARVMLKTEEDVEIVTQRIVAQPGATFGWHTHPGENVNVVAQGTLTLYHDEHCTMGTDYPAGSAFPTHPDETHLAKNLGSVDLIVFATYFAPKTTPPTPVRVDAPLPGEGCPQ